MGMAEHAERIEERKGMENKDYLIYWSTDKGITWNIKEDLTRKQAVKERDDIRTAAWKVKAQIRGPFVAREADIDGEDMQESSGGIG